MSIKTEILETLKQGKSLTGLDGLNLFGTMNLRNRISELKRDGVEIKSEWVHADNGKKFCRYFLTLLILFLPSIAHAQLKPAFTDDQAIRAVIGEAANQGYQGMYALSCALLNRNSLQGVYGAKSKQIDKEPIWVWKMARRAYYSAKNAIPSERAKYGNHWENIKAFGKPKWAYNMKEVYRYKDHVFYQS